MAAYKMARSSCILFALAVAAVVQVALAVDTLQITQLSKPETCEVQANKGDYVGVHYIGTLEDGTEFDNSYKREEEIEFQLGASQVIAGWEEGILGMCLYEKRRLTIPPHLAYGDEGIGPIPGGATLLFEVELVRVSNVPQQPQEGDEGGYELYQEAYTGGEDDDEVLSQINFGEEDAQVQWE